MHSQITEHTVESHKFKVLGTRDFISKYWKFEFKGDRHKNIQCTLYTVTLFITAKHFTISVVFAQMYQFRLKSNFYLYIKLCGAPSPQCCKNIIKIISLVALEDFWRDSMVSFPSPILGCNAKLKNYLSLNMTKNVFKISDKARLKPVYSATEAS